MDATIYDNEISENHQKKSSCNSFLDRAFFDDVPSMRQQQQYSRSYYSNRFSSYAFVMMVAVYLWLPFACMAIAIEANQTSAILSSPEALISATKHDIDNEISATLEENPISIEKENFLKSPLTENLEDTIRSSVKSEIEQNVGSPALLNALNVMPETENIVLVEYPGATTSAPKHELPIEPKAETTLNTQCEASSLSCVSPIQKELQSSTAVNIIENIAETTVVPANEILSTTTVVPIMEETTSVLDTDLLETVEQNVREGRTLESESIVQHAEKSSVEESGNSEVPATPELDNQSVKEIISDTNESALLNKPENAESTLLNNEDLDATAKPLSNNQEKTNSTPLNEENITKVDSNENEELKGLISSHLSLVEIEEKSAYINSVTVPSHNKTNEDEIIASKKPINALKTLLEVNDNQSETHDKTKDPSESLISKTVNKQKILLTSTQQNEIEIETSSQTSETIEESQAPVNTEIVSNEPIVPLSESNALPAETVDPHYKNSNIIESQEVSAEIPNTSIQAEADTAHNNEETQTEKTDLAAQSIIENNHNIVSQETTVPTTPSSEPSVIQHTNINLENDKLSIIFEEPLPATELPIPQEDDYIKTIIEMEDPLLGEAQIDQTTVQPEQLVHNVIKKQGVEPIDVEEPIDTEDLEQESTTLQPRLNNTIPEEETVQIVNEIVESAKLEGSTTPAATIDVISEPKVSTDLPAETTAQNITEVSVVFPGKGDADVNLNGKGSRSINAIHSPLADQHKSAIHFDVYPAGQTFNENLAEELPDGIGKALPTHRLNEQSANRSTVIIALCSSTAVLFIIISVAIFMISFQRQHGTLDIEMQERRDNINEEQAETCAKLLEIELPKSNQTLQTDAEAEIEECL